MDKALRAQKCSLGDERQRTLRQSEVVVAILSILYSLSGNYSELLMSIGFAKAGCLVTCLSGFFGGKGVAILLPYPLNTQMGANAQKEVSAFYNLNPLTGTETAFPGTRNTYY